ncbi:MAG: cytochrome c [Rhodocyclaceae bacterium]|nr:cytochrome c [Rhodocyclaceae bacterium]
MTIKHHLRKSAIGVAGLLFLAVPLMASAEISKFEEHIRYRKAVMTMLKWHADKISSALKNPQAFNRDEVLNNATAVEMLGRLSLEGFVPGSSEGETKAKADIWTDWGRFKVLGEKFSTETVKLRERAKSGDAAALKAQLREVNKVCKSCHDDFKSSSPF